ncbi:hypothetical protein [Klenkia brasiliensis]|uniref:Uncharacterized protein n=1 Tax=Klenkia brasiliensis TaxID=333142 RepID=A0A1G7QI67_9ACTN|nr:hypothetical protein [Klenkia brasiliensis]SDF98155.1 hypothetical protein SAMN05660324_1492 [Klenkia brasiliensis]
MRVVPLGRRLTVVDLSLSGQADPAAVRGFVHVDGEQLELGGPATLLWDAARRSGDPVEVEALARGWGLDDAGTTAGWAQLRELGAVADLEDTPDGRRDWAAAHTLHPLQPGLGEVPGRAALHQVGLPGHPVAELSRPLRDVWAWGPLFADLWASVTWHAAGYLAAGVDAPGAVDADLLLADLVESLPALLSTTAAYVDLAVGRP